MAEAAYFAGLDIGGTTVKAALLDATGGQVGDMVEVRSHGSEGYRATFKQLRTALDQLCDNNSISFDAIAAAGMGVGDYHFLGRDVRIGDDLVARSPDKSHLIGSTITMPRVAENLESELGFSKFEIQKVIEENPRKLIGETK